MPKGSLIRQYFEFEPNSNQSVCQITEIDFEECNDVSKVSVLNPCGTVIRVSNSSSMIRHVRKRHPGVYKQFQEERKEAANKTSGRSTNRSYEINQCDVIDACVELVTINGKPLTFIEDSGFRRLLELGNIEINETMVADSVSNKAQILKSKITKIINSRLISLKIDIVTRLGRSFLGIYVQLYVDGNMKIYTLSVVEVKITDTCEKLKKIVLRELSKFNISMDNVYTVTIDCAENLLKSEDNDSSLEDYLIQNESVDVTTFDYRDYQNSEILFKKLCKNSESLVDTDTSDTFIDSTICPTLKFHKIITGVLEEEKSEIINRARNAVKEFKNANVLSSLKRPNLTIPILDRPSSWITTYNMLQELLELKAICYQLSLKYKALKIQSNDWTKIKDIIDTLGPCKKALLSLQQQNVTLTELYKILSLCAMELSIVGSEFSTLLKSRIERERTNLFSNPSFICAMFLDPRFSATLECKYIDEAMKHLTFVYNRIAELEATLKNDDNAQQQQLTTEEDEFEQLLCLYEENLSEVKKLQRNNHIETLLKEFNFRPRVHSKENVIKFWESNKINSLELHKLASVFLQVPVTQFSNRRLFSEIKLLLNPGQSKTPKSVLNEIIFLRNNINDE